MQGIATRVCLQQTPHQTRRVYIHHVFVNKTGPETGVMFPVLEVKNYLWG